MDVDIEVEEALVGLGYPKQEAKRAVQSVSNEATTLEERLRAALKKLGKFS
jgi:Holliday junction resolvasome RuvABC DNA-binding subunit